MLIVDVPKAGSIRSSAVRTIEFIPSHPKTRRHLVRVYRVGVGVGVRARVRVREEAAPQLLLLRAGAGAQDADLDFEHRMRSGHVEARMRVGLVEARLGHVTYRGRRGRGRWATLYHSVYHPPTAPPP